MEAGKLPGQMLPEACRQGGFDFLHQPINELTLRNRVNRVNRACRRSQNQHYFPEIGGAYVHEGTGD